MQQVLPFQALRAKTDRVTKPLRVSQMESAASPGRVSRRAQVGRERPPVFGRWSAQTPPGSASGSLPPILRHSELDNDVDAYIFADIDDDASVDCQRDRVVRGSASEFVTLSRSVLRCKAAVVDAAVER